APRIRALPGRLGHRRPGGRRAGPQALLPVLTRRATLWAIPLPSPLPPREAGFAGTPGAGEGRVGAGRVGGHLSVEEVSATLRDALVTAMGGEGDLVSPRLERGGRCFTGLMAGEVVAYGWVTVGAEWIGELGLEIRPPVGEAYIWNCVTLPAHRLRGYFGALLLHLVETAHREGIPRPWIG